MLGRIIDDTIFLEIRILNPFEEAQYPVNGWAHAVLDTGFTGFLLLPSKIYGYLKLEEQKQKTITAETADGHKIVFKAAYATIQIRGLDTPLDGLIETNENIKEILLGVRALRQLKATINSCTSTVTLATCAEK